MYVLMLLSVFNVGFNFKCNKYEKQYDLLLFLKVFLKWMIKKGYYRFKNIRMY